MRAKEERQAIEKKEKEERQAIERKEKEAKDKEKEEKQAKEKKEKEERQAKERKEKEAKDRAVAPRKPTVRHTLPAPMSESLVDDDDDEDVGSKLDLVQGAGPRLVCGEKRKRGICRRKKKEWRERKGREKEGRGVIVTICTGKSQTCRTKKGSTATNKRSQTKVLVLSFSPPLLLLLPCPFFVTYMMSCRIQTRMYTEDVTTGPRADIFALGGEPEEPDVDAQGGTRRVIAGGNPSMNLALAAAAQQVCMHACPS